MLPSKRASSLFFFWITWANRLKQKSDAQTWSMRPMRPGACPLLPSPSSLPTCWPWPSFSALPTHQELTKPSYILTLHTLFLQLLYLVSSSLSFQQTSTSSRTSVNLQNKLCTHCLCLSGPHCNFKIIRFHNYQLMCLLVSSLWVATHLYWLS